MRRATLSKAAIAAAKGVAGWKAMPHSVAQGGDDLQYDWGEERPEARVPGSVSTASRGSLRAAR